MLHINENLYINFSSMLTFSVGNLFSRCVWFQFACFTIYIVHVWSKYRWEFSVMHFKIFLLKDHLLRTYDLGSVKSIIMKFIWLVHVVIFMIGHTAPCCDQINEIIWVAHLLQKFSKNSLFDTNINSSGSSTSLLFTAGDRDVGNQYPHLSNLHLCG